MSLEQSSEVTAAAHASPAPANVNQLLAAARQGDRTALGRIFANVYTDLKRLAHGQRQRISMGDTLSTTALVHELFFKLKADAIEKVESSEHFYALAARAMREVAIDYARAKQRVKRAHISTTDDQALGEIAALDDGQELLDICAAVERLHGLQERPATVFSLRFFLGLEEREIADLLELNERTVRRDWQRAKAWLCTWLNLEPAQLVSCLRVIAE
jgi:RNA polymerase sigma factor (TIGR02999 family)